ncbi:MAG: toxin-antitoxin system HicB family antitoxin [Nitrospinae bacterium]|nr:toxin-antitoxin system HicB family antitoxin [Nitrospinota bacterium]
MKGKSKKKKFKYLVTIAWSEEDQAYVATAPELPGCATHGSSMNEASKNIEDAIDTWLRGAKESGYPIPEPVATKTYSGKFIARIDPRLHRQLAMKSIEQGKSLNRFVEEILKEAFI